MGSTCPSGAPILAIPSMSVFCDLTTIAVRGNTLFLADGGVLIRYDVLAPQTPLRAFASTPVRGGQYTRFCAIVPMPDGVAVVAHECTSQVPP